MLVLSDPRTCDPPAATPVPRVLLIADDAAMTLTMRHFIERAGMRTALAPTVPLGMALCKSFLPDVVLLDLDLPGGDGVALIGRLAREGDCGIIAVSGRGEESERVAGLEQGADDYIVKPVRLREMLARIRAVHRRAQRRGPARPSQPIHIVGPWRVDLQRRTVLDGADGAAALTGAEFAALQALLEAVGEPVSRERLSAAALRRPWRPEDRSIDQLIFGLRRKLADDDPARRLIQSVRGAGYVLVGESAELSDDARREAS